MKRENEGRKYRTEVRTGGRRSGREVAMPVDGISGPTRMVGEQELRFKSGTAPLGDLPAGQYQLVIEAAREAGGRELVKIPLQWPVQKADRKSTRLNSSH